MPLILPGNVGSATAATGFNVANSVRMNAADSAKMTIDFSGAGNQKKFTISCWVKRAKITPDASQTILSNYADVNNFCNLTLSTGDTLDFVNRDGGTFNTNIGTSRLFRDPSAWYHVVLSVDTTQGTDTNRIKIYVNGVHETSLSSSTYPDQNTDLKFNTTATTNFGSWSGSAQYADGYYSELVFIDNAQLAADQFGEFDDSGIWKPLESVADLTFGTNGFYLDFKDSGNLGNDANGGTDLTEVNLAATDQSTDTCTNNHAIGNPLLNYNPQLTEGNLVLTSSGTAWKNSMSTIGLSSGKWYHEVKITAESGVPYGLIGVTDSYHPNSWGASPPNYLGIGALQIGYFNNNGTYYKSDTQNSYGASFTVNDIIGVLLDLDAGTPTIKFYKNDADQGSINLPTSSNSTGLWFFMHSVYIQTMSVNYGSPAHAISSGNTDGDGFGNFEFATKGGYTLNTKNLAEYG